MIEPILGPTIPSFQQTSHTHYLPHTRVIGDHMVRSEEPSSGFFSSICDTIVSFFKWLFCCGCCAKEVAFDGHLTTFKEMAGKVSVMDAAHPEPIYEEKVFSQFLASAKEILKGKPEDLSEADYLAVMKSFFEILVDTYIPRHKTIDQTVEKLGALLNEQILRLNDNQPIDNPTNPLKIQAARDVISYIEFSLTYVNYLKISAKDDLKEKVRLVLKLWDWPQAEPEKTTALVSDCLKNQVIWPILSCFSESEIDDETLQLQGDEIQTIDYVREVHRLFEIKPERVKEILINAFNIGDGGSIDVRKALRNAVQARVPREVSYITVQIPVPQSSDR